MDNEEIVRQLTKKLIVPITNYPVMQNLGVAMATWKIFICRSRQRIILEFCGERPSLGDELVATLSVEYKIWFGRWIRFKIV